MIVKSCILADNWKMRLKSLVENDVDFIIEPAQNLIHANLTNLLVKICNLKVVNHVCASNSEFIVSWEYS